MDLASLIGFIGTLGMIAGAMVSAGGLGMFVDVPSLLIVVGGSFFAVMYTAPLPVFLGSFGAMGKAFKPPIKKMDELLTRKIKLGLPIKESNILEEFYQARSPENNILGLGIDMTNIFFKESKYLNPLKNLVLKNINNFPFVRKLSQQISDKGIYF